MSREARRETNRDRVAANDNETTTNPTIIELADRIPETQVAAVVRALASSLVAQALAVLNGSPANDD